MICMQICLRKEDCPFKIPIVIIITQRFYRQLISSLKVIANFFNVSNLMEDDVMSGATDSVEK